MSLRAGPQRLLRSTPTFRESPFSSSLASASRSFSSTSLRSKSIQDPSHPTGLYYHQVETLSSRSSKPSPSWAISLLPEAPTQLDAASIIAFLRKQTSDPASVARSPDEVVVHEPFWTLLHKTLKEKVVAEDEILIFEAEMRSSGWAHLSDDRQPLMPGRIPTPENILASVAFVDGKLEPGSYERNDTYRFVTAEEGLMQLNERWLPKVRAACQKAN